MMDIWRQYTLRANTEFKLACYGNAILMHNQALDHARHQLANQLEYTGHCALDKVMISHFNLADCYLALREYQRSADCYLMAQDFLLSSRDRLPANETGEKALRQGLTQLHILWNDFIAEHADAIPYQSQLRYQATREQLQTCADASAVRH